MVLREPANRRGLCSHRSRQHGGDQRSSCDERRGLADGFADGIATGPDGALWFTAFRKIGRFVPGGAMSFFPDPGNVRRLQIVAGPDGALWVTRTEESILERITTAGAIRLVGFPTIRDINGHALLSIDDLAFAADGALWFTSSQASLILRRDRSGRVNVFRLTSHHKLVQPISIAAGSDGAMWFTTIFGIGRITRGGEITEVDIPRSRGDDARIPSGLTIGPDGALWFALRFRNRGQVGRFDIANDGRRLLIARLADRRLRGRRGRLLRIAFHVTHRALGRLEISLNGHVSTRRRIHATRGANTVALRLPTRSGSYLLELRLDKPGQTSSDTARLSVTT